jgi:tRNA 5-methylaminomethyl-2-thiouridine biosynthesis bifunctional protein
MPRQGNYSTPWFSIPFHEVSSNTATIIGGGLAGITTAYSLAALGWKITLIERDYIASGASGNPAGIIMPLISHKNDTLGLFYSEGYKAILATLATLALPSWQACGVIDINPKHSGKSIQDLCITNDLIEPITYLGHEGFYFKDGGHLNVTELCHALLNTYSHNITVIEELKALELNYNGKKWSTIAQDGGTLESDIVIVANSYDILHLPQTNWLPIEKVRGQITFLPKLNIPLSSVVCQTGYITPEKNGFHVVGATYDRTSSVTVSEQDHIENLNPFIKLFSLQLDDLNITQLKGRVAFRASTPDRRAIVGPAPIYESFKQDYTGLLHGKHFESHEVSSSYYPGLYINTAHGSRGLTSCLLSAQYLTQCIHPHNSNIASELMQLLLPARFIIRELKRSIASL